jgi:hypothetical protein
MALARSVASPSPYPIPVTFTPSLWPVATHHPQSHARHLQPKIHGLPPPRALHLLLIRAQSPILDPIQKVPLLEVSARSAITRELVREALGGGQVGLPVHLRLIISFCSCTEGIVSAARVKGFRADCFAECPPCATYRQDDASAGTGVCV